MKLQCEIIRDLIPLMEDDVCSSQSKQAVLEHIEHCEECKKIYKMVQVHPIFEMDADETKAKKVLGKGFRKVKRRWLASILAVLLVIPIVLFSVNQYRGEGICFTNLDDIYVVGRYLDALEKSDWNKMASYMNYDAKYEEIMGFLQMEQSDFEAKFHSFKSGNQEWMVREDFYNLKCKNLTNEMDFWNIVLDQTLDVLIPTDVWNSILATHPDSVIKLEENRYEINGCDYVSFDCEWGSYMVQSTSAVFQCESAFEYCATLDIVPIEIYEQGKDALHTEAKESYNYIQGKYGAVANMTEDEFCDFMMDAYATQLKDGLNGSFTLTHNRYDRSYYNRDEKHWLVVYEMTFSQGNNDYVVHMHFSVEDQKIINLASTGYNPAYRDKNIADKLDKLIDALILSYPE